MLNRPKVNNKGFLGAAKPTRHAPYYQLPRTPDMYPAGKNSKFITPDSEEERKQSPHGMKR